MPNFAACSNVAVLFSAEVRYWFSIDSCFGVESSVQKFILRFNWSVVLL